MPNLQRFNYHVLVFLSTKNKLGIEKIDKIDEID